MGRHVSSRETVSNHPLLSAGGGESAVHCSLARFYSEGLFVDHSTEIIDQKWLAQLGLLDPAAKNVNQPVFIMSEQETHISDAHACSTLADSKTSFVGR